MPLLFRVRWLRSCTRRTSEERPYGCTVHALARHSSYPKIFVRLPLIVDARRPKMAPEASGHPRWIDASSAPSITGKNTVVIREINFVYRHKHQRICCIRVHRVGCNYDHYGRQCEKRLVFVLSPKRLSYVRSE